MHYLLLATVIGLLCQPLVPISKGPDRDPITEWSLMASELASSSGMSPFRAPLTFALLHLAMFEAVSAADGGPPPSQSTAAAGRQHREPVSRGAAAIEAGRLILLTEFPGAAAAIQARSERLVDLEPDTAARANGTRLGADVAETLLRARASDKRNATVPYSPGTGAGAWTPTPPAFSSERTAFLAGVMPFTMDRPSQVRTSGPPVLQSRRWADEYNEVKRKGARDSTERSAAETATALFWEPLAGTVWPATIRRLAHEQRLDLRQSARFQAAAFVAFADALIACWDAKYHFNFWRPVTAIRGGDTDGNDLTEPDSHWEPLATTPNFPEYASGHACATGAVTHTIEHFFDGRVPIPARNVVTGEERVYRRAEDVVREVVEARMLLGVHFRSADEDGAEIGRRVAALVRQRFLK